MLEGCLLVGPENRIIDTNETASEILGAGLPLTGADVEDALPNYGEHTPNGNEMVHVRIADNGPGISDDRKEAISDQGEMGIESEGTGLGLYLVNTLVKRSGGDVRVEDNNPHGALFIIMLPIADTV